METAENKRQHRRQSGGNEYEGCGEDSIIGYRHEHEQSLGSFFLPGMFLSERSTAIKCQGTLISAPPFSIICLAVVNITSFSFRSSHADV